jgi:hypothetical protein
MAATFHFLSPLSICQTSFKLNKISNLSCFLYLSVSGTELRVLALVLCVYVI